MSCPTAVCVDDNADIDIAAAHPSSFLSCSDSSPISIWCEGRCCVVCVDRGDAVGSSGGDADPSSVSRSTTTSDGSSSRSDSSLFASFTSNSIWCEGRCCVVCVDRGEAVDGDAEDSEEQPLVQYDADADPSSVSRSTTTSDGSRSNDSSLFASFNSTSIRCEGRCCVVCVDRGEAEEQPLVQHDADPDPSSVSCSTTSDGSSSRSDSSLFGSFTSTSIWFEGRCCVVCVD